MRVEGVIYAQVRFDGKTADELGLVIDNIATRVHTQYYVPTCDFVFYDIKGYFAAGVPDGTDFDVQLALDNDPANVAPNTWRTFRVFKSRQSFDNVYRSYTISAYLSDAHRYFIERISKAYRGSASEVVGQVMGECGLQYDCHNTADTQTWYAENETRAEFLYRRVIPHMYAGDSSCMMAGYSLQSGQYMVRNLMEEIVKAPRWYLANQGAAKLDYLITEARPSLDSGVMNKMSGFGLETRSRNLLGDTQDRYTAVTVSKSQKALSIGLNSLAAAGIRIPTLNIGNQHANHARARHQNSRILGTFTSWLDVLVRQTTQIELFDVLDINFNTAQNANVAISGRYVCIGRAQVGTNREYCERICLVSNSVNATAGLVAA